MRTSKVIELRELFSLMKFIIIKYCKYEKYYERHSAELLKLQNNQLTYSIEELKSLVLAVKGQVDEERQRAEERERRAENERLRAEERERLAEERSQRLSAQIEKNIDTLRNNIAPNIVPQPINDSKRRNLGKYFFLFINHIKIIYLKFSGLYRTSNNRSKWYLMRRREEGWRGVERKLQKRGMRLIRKWTDVPHAV